MKHVCAALASLALVGTPLSASAQAHGGFSHGGGRFGGGHSEGFGGGRPWGAHSQGFGGYRSSGLGDRGGYSGYRGRYYGRGPYWGYGAGLGFALGLSFGYPWYYGYPGYHGYYVPGVVVNEGPPPSYYDDPWAREAGVEASAPPGGPACGQWVWDAAGSKYVWSPGPCPAPGASFAPAPTS